jgi:hypothetical protein
MDTGFILTRGHVRDSGIVNWLEGPLGKDLADVPGLGRYKQSTATSR